jgi:CheY-like chemotaxis protein
VNAFVPSQSRTCRARAERVRPPPLLAVRPVLLVDDDPVSREVITLCLAELGLSNPIDELGSGEQAIDQLRQYVDDSDAPLPALVLLDLRMPGCSGQDVLAWMRATPRLADIPVVVLTADDDAKSVTMLYRLGVRSYLVKPVGFAALASVIRDLDMPWMLT